MIHRAVSRNIKRARAGVQKHWSALAAASFMILIVATVLPVSAQDAELMKFFQDTITEG